MAVEIPLEVTADTGPVKAMVSELETLKNTLKADKRAIEDLKASIADMQIKLNGLASLSNGDIVW